jgi:hypothetical protein
MRSPEPTNRALQLAPFSYIVAYSAAEIGPCGRAILSGLKKFRANRLPRAGSIHHFDILFAAVI